MKMKWNLFNGKNDVRERLYSDESGWFERFIKKKRKKNLLDFFRKGVLVIKSEL